VIPAALAVLATEFVWARRLLQRVRHQLGNLVGRGQEPRSGRSD